MPEGPSEVTRLLDHYREGDRDALERLLPLVYDELRTIAARHLRRERSDHTLQPTALVHEAYLRLADQEGGRFENRAHFFGIAARLMRQILVDHARTHNREKRGGGLARVTLADEVLGAQEPDLDLIALDDALKALAEIEPELCRLVELRYFGGLTIEETAEVLGTSPATVKRDWAMAKAFLHRRLRADAERAI
jgi:RNA polymerase sigma factor (TIGR02999 family)